ncbi:transglutaminase domain-containing protein [Psychroserpens sp.]|uniref:transglutaminase domain-containing protein n=1 Tax=Psychroserpens sp. TaxID=2020870 RepID=UPI002B26EEF9|nr:transglutaminase domain-containing protein [Psychroserpens sp.]
MRYLLLFIVAFQSHAQISDFDHIDFKKADQIALACKDEGLDNLPQLSFKLTENLTTDVERFRAIYKWVCSNIANDYNLYLRNKRKRTKFKNDSLKLKAWNDRFKKEIFRKLLKQDKTICTGYAYIVQELSKLANLDCEIVHGFGQTSTTNIEEFDVPNHSWNAIKLNNKWYLCDPTWASGIPNQETFAFKFQYNDGYFLADPKLFSVNHFPLENKWSLLDSNPTFEEFLGAPIIYGKAYSNLTDHKYPKQMHQVILKNNKVTFRYQLQKTVDAKDVHFLIDNGFHPKTVKPSSIVLDNLSLTLELKFEDTGFYDTHFLIGNDLIATYTFKVEK